MLLIIQLLLISLTFHLATFADMSEPKLTLLLREITHQSIIIWWTASPQESNFRHYTVTYGELIPRTTNEQDKTFDWTNKNVIQFANSTANYHLHEIKQLQSNCKYRLCVEAELVGRPVDAGNYTKKCIDLTTRRSFMPEAVGSSVGAVFCLFLVMGLVHWVQRRHKQSPVKVKNRAPEEHEEKKARLCEIEDFESI